MKKLNKKGFTIVELVIVIAVIAILAAVLIPTFSGVVDKANKSAALQGARNAFTSYMSDYADKDNDVDLILINSAKTYAYEVVDGQINATALATVPTVVTHPTVYYTEAECNSYNLSLEGARKTTTVKTPAAYYTAQEAIDANAELDDALSAGATISDVTGLTLNDDYTVSGEVGSEVYTLTAAGAIKYNSGLDEAVDEGDEKTAAIYYTEEECNEYNITLEGARKTTTVKTEESADTVNTDYVKVGEFNGWTVYAK